MACRWCLSITSRRAANNGAPSPSQSEGTPELRSRSKGPRALDRPTLLNHLPLHDSHDLRCFEKGFAPTDATDRDDLSDRWRASPLGSFIAVAELAGGRGLVSINAHSAAHRQLSRDRSRRSVSLAGSPGRSEGQSLG